MPEPVHATRSWRRHLQQGGMFLAVGIAQLALDSGVFIASTALGATVVAGNLLGRTSGATLGFWLNGRWTFGKQRLDWKHALRFALTWLVLTALSTTLVALVAARLGLHDAWLAKPLVEAGLAAVSFFLWKYLVFG